MNLFYNKTFVLSLAFIISLILTSCAPVNKKTSKPQACQETSSTELKVEILKQQKDIAVWDSLSTLQITNKHGNIFVRHTDEPFIGVLSTMQLIGECPEKGGITFTETQDQLVLSIDYDSDKTIGINTLVNGHKKGRVDLVVFVPNSITLDLISTYGSINVKRLSNDIKVSTLSGKVKFSGSGQTNIKTVSGDIYAYLYKPNWAMSSIESQQGNIIFTFPDINDFNMTVNSPSKIHNNFNADINFKNGLNLFSHPAITNSIHVSNKKGLIKLVNIKSQQIKLPNKEKKS